MHVSLGKMEVKEALDAYVGRIDCERLDVLPSKRMHHAFVLSSVADDVDDEAAAFHVKRQRLCERQRRRARNDDNLGASTVSCPLCTPCFSIRLGRLVPLKDGCAANNNNNAREDLVTRNPVLRSLKRTHRYNRYRCLDRRRGPHRVGQPSRRGQGFANNVGGAVNTLVDKLGDAVRVLPNLLRDLAQLESERGKRVSKERIE